MAVVNPQIPTRWVAQTQLHRGLTKSGDILQRGGPLESCQNVSSVSSG
jgi:hypothetical protein